MALTRKPTNSTSHCPANVTVCPAYSSAPRPDPTSCWRPSPVPLVCPPSGEPQRDCGTFKELAKPESIGLFQSFASMQTYFLVNICIFVCLFLTSPAWCALADQDSVIKEHFFGVLRWRQKTRGPELCPPSRFPPAFSNRQIYSMLFFPPRNLNRVYLSSTGRRSEAGGRPGG